MSESELVAAVARDRAAGNTVALANGCFDLLHVGHVRYLQGAAAEADRLIVAVNDDPSVAGLKGDGRPILPASDRAELVAALRGVDYVVVFGDPDVERLLLLLKPDVHCKGTDYTVESVPERAVVAGYGGRTAIVGDAKNHATREILVRVARTQDQGRTTDQEPSTKHQGPGAPVTRFLIVRLGALGDVVHAIPVAAALRRAFPAARIDWLVSAKHREILDLVPVIDRRLIVNDRPSTLRRAQGRPERTRGTTGSGRAEDGMSLAAAIRELRGARYDVALDLQGLIKSAVLARASGAARVVGFSPRYARERLARLFYTDAYDPGAGGMYDPRETRHVVTINLGLLRVLGVTAADAEFPIAQVESEAARAASRQTGGRYALLNPGAAWPNKRWPPSRLGAVAAQLRARHGLMSVVLWGPGEEALAAAVVAGAGGAAVLSAKTSIADLVALARGAALMVSGDTGPTHVAAAVGTPIVGIYGPTRPARNGPWSPDDITVSRDAVCECHHRRRCRLERMCLLDIEVAEVMAAVDRRLSAAPGRVREGQA